ncbi:MAG: enoyl-CoA hydratase-related protein, partial [Candidatus Rokuibacteriota bacterium]
MTDILAERVGPIATVVFNRPHDGAQTEAAYLSIRDCPKPTLAMIYGYCLGGAMAVAMACDMRFAAEGSKFGIPAARLNIILALEAFESQDDKEGTRAFL